MNTKLFEVNARVWVNNFGGKNGLNGIPKDYFTNLVEKGIESIWLMGIWKTCADLIDSCCLQEDLIASYSRSLKDWKREDIIGSPYAIDGYDVNPLLGTLQDLMRLKKRINDEGLKLILDFVPNHFGASSKIIKTHPQIFLQGTENQLKNDPSTFFRPSVDPQKIFAHGRDPFFPAWTDTIQINYFNPDARKFMLDTLLSISDLCDGVRCDMAMLNLTNVFENTWLGCLEESIQYKPKNEFWEEAIKTIKQKSPGFIFIAEAYWDLEWQLQQLGFDFTYDKRLLDRLLINDPQGIMEHLQADEDYQLKSVRFLENHDENRSVAKFGKHKSMAAATIISSLQGMKLYYDGQFEGKKIKLPVQLGRKPVEKVSQTINNYYDLILKITKDDIFKYGDWILLEPETSGGDNISFKKILAWRWKLKDDNRIVVINYSDNTTHCRLKFDVSIKKELLLLTDLLDGKVYKRSASEITNKGLFIELKNFHSHIFSFKD